MSNLTRRGVLAAAATSAAAIGLTPGIARADTAATSSAAPTGSGSQPDFGPNVYVFGPDTPAAEVQAAFNRVLAVQEHNEMGLDRYAFLLRPGAYHLNAKLGYYTTIAGLGRSPEDTAITGAVTVGPQPDPNGP